MSQSGTYHSYNPSAITYNKIKSLEKNNCAVWVYFVRAEIV